MPRPICVPCGLFYRPKRNDITWEEGLPVKNAEGVESWEPYKLWDADLWRCEECGHEMVTGHGARAIYTHHEEGYSEYRAQRPPVVRVDDC